MRLTLHVASLVLAFTVVVSGCANDGYGSARCQACDGRTFSASDCARFAATAGCAGSSVDTPDPGCSGRCVFTDCTGVPLCTGLAPRDAGGGDDAP